MIDPARPRPPSRNRVGPLGEIVAAPGRGAWTGNRGILHHEGGGRDVVRNSRNRAWITCALSFRDRRLPQWEPGHYTPLFFLDEAVALAAGHRPCAECRRGDFNAYRTAWAAHRGGALPYAKELDKQLNIDRRDAPAQVAWSDLPDGVFVRLPDGPAVVVGDRLAIWEPDNRYGRHLTRPRSGAAVVLTPACSVDVLRAGYPVQLDAGSAPDRPAREARD